MTRPTWTEPTLFDDVLGTPVPTMHRDGAEQSRALEAARASATDLEAFCLGATGDLQAIETARAELLRRGIDPGPVRLHHYVPATDERPELRVWTCAADR